MEKNSDNYIPDTQDIIFINFDPAIGKEIKKRRPAVVLSNKGYSEITGLTVICPITHADNNRLKDFFVKIPKTSYENSVDGFVNPLQFFTYDFRKRSAQKIGVLPTSSFVEVKETVLNILD